MKKKYQRALIIIGILILVIGVSFGYYMINNQVTGNSGNVNVRTVTLEQVGFNIEGQLEFEDLDIYPGHKNISKIKVTALGNNDTINYRLVWEGINSLKTPLKYYVYETKTSENPSITCSKQIEQVGASKHYYETCEEKDFTNLGTIINTGEITSSETPKEFVLAGDKVIKGTQEGNIIYYYVVLEYPNLEESQNIDMGGVFEGKVTVKKEEDLLADITIKKMYQETTNGYEEITTMPSEGYIINNERSTCTNNATPIIKNNKVLVTNLTSNGTECNLYFDKYIPTASETILANITPKDETPDFSQVATTDEGVFKAEDGMYGGTSYYWRGAVENNYVKFANFCWRIIRINGDGSLRLIYDGSTCHENGTNTTDSIAVARQTYNTNSNQSNYVGWTYEGNLQRPTNNDTATASNAKAQLDSWYDSNLKSYESKIADGKYCNDRDVQAGSSYESSTFYYAGNKRLFADYKPTLSCQSRDVYTLSVGLISADEVEFAGGNTKNNSSYYLYNGQSYWSMTPYANYSYSLMIIVDVKGTLYANGVNNTIGLRPVINLRSDITFSDGNGSQSNPYVVS